MLSRSSCPRTWHRGFAAVIDSTSLPPVFLCPSLAQRRLRPAPNSRLRHQFTSKATSSSSSLSSITEASKRIKKQQRLRDEQAKLQGTYKQQDRFSFNTHAPPSPGAKAKQATPAVTSSLEPWIRVDSRAGPKAWREAFTGGPAFGDEDWGRSVKAEKTRRGFDDAIAASSEPEKLQVVLDLARDLVARPTARLAAARRVEPGMQEVLDEAWALLSLSLYGHRNAFEAQPVRKSETTSTLSDADRKAGLICVVYLSRAAYASSLPVVSRLKAAAATSLGPPNLLPLEDLVVDAGRAQDPQRVLSFVDDIVGLHSGVTTAWLLYARARALSTRAAQGYDWGSISKYWQRYSTHRIHQGREPAPPRYLFEFLLHHYVAQRDVIAAQTVLCAMAEAGHQPNAGTWLVLLRAHAALRPTVTALASLAWADTCRKSGGDDGTSRSHARKSTLDDLVRLRASQLDARGALLVLRVFGVTTVGQSRSRGAIFPSASTYAPLVDMFSKLAAPHLALRFCALAFEYRQSNEHLRLQRALLGALNSLRRAELAPQALALARGVLGIHSIPMSAQQSPILLSSSIKPTQALYAALIRITAQLPLLQAPSAARVVLLDMFARDMRPGTEVMRSLGYLLFATMANAIDWDRAKRTLYSLSPDSLRRRVRRLESRVEKETDKAKLIAHAESLNRLDQFVRVLDKLGFEDKIVLSASRNVPKDVSQAAPAVPSHPRQAQPQPSTSVPHSPPRQSGDNKTAVEHEVDLSVPLRPAGYAMRLRVYAVQRLDHASASALFRAMIHHGISPNMQHIAPLVEGLVEAGQMHDASRVASRAVASLGVEATLRIHTALIRGYAQQGDWQSVEQQLHKVQVTGLPVDSTLQEILATARSRAREADGVKTSESDIALLDQPREALSTQGLSARTSVLMKAGAYLPAQKVLVDHLTAQGLQIDAILRREILNMGNWVDKQVRKQSQDLTGRYSEVTAESVRTQREIEAILARRRAQGRGDANARAGARRKIVKLIFEAIVKADMKGAVRKIVRKEEA